MRCARTMTPPPTSPMMDPTPYFEILRPDHQRLPIVFDVPHAGEWIPPEVAQEMSVGELVLRRDLDLYVDRLWADAPTLGATLVASRVSRYVVDLNRADIEELMTLPGVGPKLAEVIIEHRRYETFDDLERVPGLGPEKIRRITDRVMLG